MKLFYGLFLLILSFSVQAQTDTSSAKITLPLKKGFYKNYQELIDNSPSYTDSFTVRLLVSNIDSITILGAKFFIPMSSKPLKNTWGFCDGKFVYINYDGSFLQHKGWVIRQFDSPYFIFYKNEMIYHTPLSVPVIPGYFGEALSTLATLTLPEAVYNVMLINKNGKVKIATTGRMRKILSTTPELLRNFDAENYIYQSTIEDYLLRYNKLLRLNKGVN